MGVESHDPLPAELHVFVEQESELEVHEVAAVEGAEVHDEVPTSQLYSVQ